MHLLKFIPIKLTLCLVPGIVLGKYFALDLYAVLGFVAFSMGILTALFLTKRPNPILFTLFTGLTTLGIGMLSVTLWQPMNDPDHYMHHDHSGDHVWKVKIQEVMKPTGFSDRYVARAKALDNVEVSGILIVNMPSDSSGQRFTVDDELLVYGRIEAVKPPLNPHQFNYAAYLKDQGITHQFRIISQDVLPLQNPSRTIYGRTADLRGKIVRNLKKAGFGEQQLGIIQALLLGQRNDISEETYNDYKNAGAVHILAVSGLHIGILLFLLQFFLKPLEYLPKGKHVKLIVIVVLLWGFAFLASLSASVVRAVTMFSFVAYALYLNRPSNTFNILALSMFFILLLVNPMWLFHVGFQMSYAAVFAIVWLYPLLQKLWKPKNSFLRKTWQLLCVSAAAQLGVLPISLFYFHQFPGLFFVSNLLIIPFLGAILGIGILVIILSLLNMLPSFLVVLYNSVIGLMNGVVGFVARQEAFVFKDIPFDGVQLILAYVLIISLVLALTKPTFRNSLVFLALVITFQSWLLYISYKTAGNEKLVLAHQPRNSALIHQKGSKVFVLTNSMNSANRLITDYKVGEHIGSIRFDSLKNSYSLSDKKLWVLDSLGLFPSDKVSPHYVLLTQSPKINLERFIDSIRPAFILADGSNYSSYVERWKATSAHRKLPFHYTGEMGAYYFDLND